MENNEILVETKIDPTVVIWAKHQFKGEDAQNKCAEERHSFEKLRSEIVNEKELIEYGVFYCRHCLMVVKQLIGAKTNTKAQYGWVVLVEKGEPLKIRNLSDIDSKEFLAKK